jgi:hypothetical protein
MTELRKSLKRQTVSTRSNRGRVLIIELRPGAEEVVFIREQGMQLGYTVPLSKIWQLGARMEAESRMKERTSKRRKSA